MKFFVVLVLGLIGISTATQPITPTIIEDISTCLNAAGIVDIPVSLSINYPIVIQPQPSITIIAKLDCTFLASLVNLSTEISYTEVTNDFNTDFTLELLTPTSINLNVNIDVVISLYGIPINLGGTIIIVYNNFIMNIIVDGTFLTGDISTCTINEIDVDCNYTIPTIRTASGSNSFIDAIVKTPTLPQDLFNDIETKINNILDSCF